jgi:alcohol dehydrogenase class IV
VSLPAFAFTSPAHVVFGAGALRESIPLLLAHGPRLLLLTGGTPDRAAPLTGLLRAAGAELLLAPVRGEPTFTSVRSLVAEARSFRPDAVAALGGGSVIDTGKAVAMLLTNGGDPLDYAEVIGRNQPVTRPALPFTALPTTAGAGAEATRNAVLRDPEQHIKVSLRSPLMVPRLVIIDPTTTSSLSPAVTAATGLDALSQLIEPLVSIKANPATDALCRAGIPRIARALPRACATPDDLEARADLALAAWWSGLALANAGLGAVHGFAAALGGMIDAPHGLICARFLVPVMRTNLDALRASGPEGSTGLDRYREIAALLTGYPDASAEDGLAWLTTWINALPLPPLPPIPDPAATITAAAHSSSMKGNPVPLSPVALAQTLTAAKDAPVILPVFSCKHERGSRSG